MQSLPINAIQSAAPAQQSSQVDSNAAPASEPFGNVLARQRASHAEAPARAVQNNKQATSASASDASAVSSNGQAADPQAPAADVAGNLPGDILAALMPALPAPEEAGANEKTRRSGLESDDPGALSGDTQATLASSYAALLDSSSSMQPQAAMTGKPDESAQPIDKQAATLFSSTQDAGLPSTAPNPAQNGNFSAAIEAAGKNGAKTAQFESKAAEFDAKGSAKADQFDTKADQFEAKNDSRAAQFNTKAAEFDAKGSIKAGQFDAKAAELAAKVNDKAAPFDTRITPADASASLAAMTQIGTAPVASSQTVPAHATIGAPVSHSAWGDEFSQKITWLATQHEQSAELHLNPPQLGPLDVVIKVSGDQATAMFTSPHAAVRDAVEQALPKLREMLSDNGITLGNAMVSDQSPREQPAWMADKHPSGNDKPAMETVSVANSLPSGVTALPAQRHHGLLDTFA